MHRSQRESIPPVAAADGVAGDWVAALASGVGVQLSPDCGASLRRAGRARARALSVAELRCVVPMLPWAHRVLLRAALAGSGEDCAPARARERRAQLESLRLCPCLRLRLCPCLGPCLCLGL